MRIKFLFVFAFVVGTGPLMAQTGPPPRRTDPVQRELQRRVETQMIETALERSPARSDTRNRTLVISQIRDDFLRIQILDRKLMRGISQDNQLDFDGIAKSAAEIRKRASRLKTNLALPAAEVLGQSKPAEVTNPEQLRSSLTILSNLINAFVSNPVFISLKVVDAQLSAKALQDLEQIIDLSGHVKTSGERMKAAGSGWKRQN